MTRRRVTLPLLAALAPASALLLPPELAAQSTSGPGLSSGSGQGTGTGSSSTIQRNVSGSASGVGPGTPGRFRGPESGELSPFTDPAGTGVVPARPGSRSGDAGGLYPPGMLERGRFDLGVPLGPGVMTRFPDDPALLPLDTILSEGEGESGFPTQFSSIPAQLVRAVRAIEDPAERSISLDRIASAAILSNQLGLSQQILRDAAEAAFQIPDSMVRDQRLISIITTSNNLAEAHLREGKVTDAAALRGLDEDDAPDGSRARDDQDRPAALPEIDRRMLIRRADQEWRRATFLAERIANPTYRSEMIYRVVDHQAFGSQTVANEFPREDAEPKSRDETGSARPEPLRSIADRILSDATAAALRIERPVWRDRALVAIATAAAASNQFDRALDVARRIPQPEVRSDALVRIAEAQARHGGEAGQAGATATYYEAAQAVASIPLEDPRAVLTGVLIDNLIAVGRYEDARATVRLYPDEPRQLIALGAIAESQGRRGVADSAVEWIRREVPVQHRPQVYRRLYSGIRSAIESNRSRDISGNREQ